MTNIPRLNQKHICFLFIDLQEKLLARIQNADDIIRRNQLLIEAANLLHLPYMLTCQYRKGLGEISEALTSKTTISPLEKTSFSCISDAAIVSKLEQIDRRSLIVSGIETHICVLQTTLDLLGRGYQVSVVADAVGARGEVDHALGLKRMEAAGATLVTAEMVIYELLGRSDTDAFKQMLPLIKSL
jgi:nicotinamidase-related amidase